MRNRSGIQGVASSPILVGAVTVLVIIVAVFLAYNANNGLPFVSTYNLKAQGAQRRRAGQRQRGADRRRPGRHGQVGRPGPARQRQRRRRALAQPRQERRTAAGRLDDHDPAEVGAGAQVPADHPRQLLARASPPAKRSRSRAYTPGTGRHRPVLRHVRRTDPQRDPPEPGRLRQRPRRPRAAAERSVRRPAAARRPRAAGAAHARRARAPTSPASGARSRTSRRRSPRSPRRRPASSSPSTAPSPPSPASPVPTSRKRSKRAPRPWTPPTPTCPPLRPFFHDSARFFTALKPGAHALAETSPMIAAALHAGVPVLNASPVLNAQLQPTAEALVDFQRAPGVFNGLDLLIDTNNVLKPALQFIAPAQTTCNYVTLTFRNLASATSGGNRQGQLAQPHHLRAAGRAQQRGRARLGPGERPRLRQPPALQPVSEYRCARPAARLRSRQREVRGRQDRDRTGPGNLGNHHPRPGRKANEPPARARQQAGRDQEPPLQAGGPATR